MDPSPPGRQLQLLKGLRVLAFTCGVVLSAHLVWKREWGNAALTFAISVALLIWNLAWRFAKSVLKNLDRILVEDRAPRVANWIADAAERAVQKGWWLATSRFRRKYYKSLVNKYHAYRTLGLTIKGRHPLNLHDVFVPLKVE